MPPNWEDEFYAQFTTADSLVSDTVFFTPYPCTQGCTDENALNYNVNANSDDGSCEFDLVQGCMDETACNYDATAEQDNGSCTYAAEGLDCDGNCLTGVNVVYTAGGWAYENSFTISDCFGTVLAEMTSGTDGFSGCVEVGDAYNIDLVVVP